MARSPFLLPLALLPLALLPFMTGCPVYQVCTDDLRYALDITVVDADGAPVTGATGTYSVDGGAETDCEGSYQGTVTCGAEAAGELTVIISASGYQDETLTRVVDADECHVIGQEVELTLTATD